ncbi:hypothetical protein ATANTOWER_019147 [Ataeniobius toweri]|uniref:Uncharacterized protein n=1 Tax=Ataeniobius toweri TaxID=208326 RepID=A0ABU7CJL8_9TELE|nr:hypothetical protein [Ataeniobius toweri]
MTVSIPLSPGRSNLWTLSVASSSADCSHLGCLHLGWSHRAPLIYPRTGHQETVADNNETEIVTACVLLHAPLRTDKQDTQSRYYHPVEHSGTTPHVHMFFPFTHQNTNKTKL